MVVVTDGVKQVERKDRRYSYSPPSTLQRGGGSKVEVKSRIFFLLILTIKFPYVDLV